MKYIKTVLLLTTLMILSACTGSSNYYVLSMAQQPASVYTGKNRVMGVEKVLVPAYLYKRELAIAKSASQITLLGSAKWGEDMDEGLTNRLISFLQKKFREPRVYAYPWDTGKQPDIKIKVQISRFIAQGDRVYLDANWEVESLSTDRTRSRLFNTSVPAAAGNAESVVNAMDAAFRQLEESIASGVKSF